ncbi:MAG: hypothetical protein HFH69_03285 [Lachnospiraceae bacterium]|nr:hypothetical protein [Lachnospiraceae bacterium]
MPRGKKQETSVAKETKTAVKEVAVKNDDKVKESATAEVKKEEAVKAEPVAEEPAAKEEAKAPVRRRGRKAGQKKAAPAVKKTVAKKAEKEMVHEVYFEYNHEQILTEGIIERIQEAYKNEGHRISSIKSLRVYINLEARRAYYVINDKAEGKFVEF